MGLSDYNILFRFATTLFYYLIAVPLLGVFDRIAFGLKIQGKENIRALKGKGAVIVCNHMHYFDCTFLGLLIAPRRPIFTSLNTNFNIPVVGPLIHCLGAIPVPDSFAKMRCFIEEMVVAAKKGRLICVYPEGELVPYCNYFREFRRGAFVIAAKADVPIIPVVITQNRRGGLWKLLKRKPCFTMTAGAPIYAQQLENQHRTIAKLYDDVMKEMERMLGCQKI